MLSNNRLPSSMAVTIEAKLSSVKTMSAASLATSLPLRPMAMPTSEIFKAGESFTPSPVMTQNAFLRCMASTMRTLVVGLHRASTSGRCSISSIWAMLRLSKSLATMISLLFLFGLALFRIPISYAMAVAVLTWSPVSIWTVMPAFWHFATAAADSSLGGS